MALQYISDNSGNHTAVVIPIDEWNNITAVHTDPLSANHLTLSVLYLKKLQKKCYWILNKAATSGKEILN
jgi:hypothetical protein